MIKLINRFLHWRAYRKNLAVRYKMATDERLPWAFIMGSESAELIITNRKLFGGRIESERERDIWDEYLDD